MPFSSSTLADSKVSYPDSDFSTSGCPWVLSSVTSFLFLSPFCVASREGVRKEEVKGNLSEGEGKGCRDGSQNGRLC